MSTAPEQETEFKYLLSVEDYQKLLEALGKPRRERRFVNRYFTVEGGTERRDWVLRLRVEGDKRELTLKIGREIGPGIFDSTEFNCCVPSEQPADWVDTEPIKVLRAEVSTSPIVTQGETRNTRLLYPAPVEVGRIWELDRCHLPNDREFCELEIEVTSPVQEEQERKLRQWLKNQGVEPRPSDRTKYARFLASLS